MKKFLTLYLLFFFSGACLFAQTPDSVYLFSYTDRGNEGRGGLFFAWSRDRVNWQPIGPGHAFVKSDYGPWGSDKRMFNPVLFKGANGRWHSMWDLTGKEGPYAFVESPDLVYWGRQTYSLDQAGLKSVPAGKFSDELKKQQEVHVMGNLEKGSVNRVSWPVVAAMIQAQQLSAYKNLLWSETTKDDAVRFASLKPVELSITPNPSDKKKISDLLVGAFFEDINYAADGGLYAELVQNRGFEYEPSDRGNREAGWNSKKAWSINGDGTRFNIDTVSALHENNRHYAVLQVSKTGAALVNEGFDGIPLKAGEKYDLSLFARMLSGTPGKISARLKDRSGKTIAQTVLNAPSSQWKKSTAILTANETVNDARLELVPQITGSLAIDMVSLFPQNTFKGRKNGLRKDLAETIANLHPKFIRFPGGCVAHGNGIDNIYHWQHTVGPLEARKGQRNIWNYHQSMGLGYYEYFQFCEDIGAQPLPVLAAGVPCQNSGKGPNGLAGQQGGIPMSEMDEYTQGVLDLIEWANGSVNTKWGKIRAAAGHPRPFNLKYVGIGNEDLITDIFEERFRMIYDAVKKKHPEITVVGTVGPFFEGTDYTEGWELATQLKVPVVDEHYYVSPGWYIYNQDFYDKYDRNKPKVYVGEYAAHLPGRPNNLETALAEAIHLTALERNGDVVHMSSYAPMLAKEGNTQWNPDMIYFNNTEVKPTVGYEVQKLFGNNAGDVYVPATALYSNNWDKVTNRLAWSIVENGKNKELVLKLVNMLPAEAGVKVDLTKFNLAVDKPVKWVLTGNPADKNVRPVQTDISVSDAQKFILPAYSFTVIKMKLK